VTQDDGTGIGIKGALAMTADVTVEVVLLLLMAPFVGSFLGSVVLRLPQGRSFLLGRSSCPQCAHVLAARDLVPIASWLTQRAHCRYCGGEIALFYPAIEIGALVVAAWSLMVVPGWMAPGACAFGWMLLALAIIDQRHFLLPDVIVVPLAALGLAVTWLIDPALVPGHLIGLLAGCLGMLAINRTYRMLRGHDGLGDGDAKLLGAIGAWVGWQGLPTVLVYAAVAGLLVSLIRDRHRRDLRLETAVPFGPGLCVGAWLVWLYGPLELIQGLGP